VGLLFNITYDSSVNSAPAAFKTVFNEVIQFLATTFSNPITINLEVGWGEVDGVALASGSLGESEENLVSPSYAQITSALAANATSSADASAVASLPSTSPVSGSYYLTRANAKALGLLGTSSASDGAVGFSSTAAFDYDDSNGVSAGTYDLFGTIAHEITEVMGRILVIGDPIGSASHAYSTMDLFHYAAPGVRDFVGTTAGYVSPDGGTTNLDNFNTNPGGDFGDWAASAGNNSFDAFSYSGVVNGVTASDLTTMDILGYNLTSSTTVVAPAVADDFNGDGKSDILWGNTDGTVGIWAMNGTQVLSEAGAGQAPTSWQIAGTGDFNGDGKADIVWRNTDGSVGLWEMNGSQILSEASLGQADNSWQIAGVGDFNGDGKSDLLWHNANGTAAIWEMNGSQIVSETSIGQADTSWQIAGVGDFNGDGKSDILWQNTNGSVAIWEMNGSQILSEVVIGQDAGMQIAGVGDFNGVGKSDILFQNAGGGAAIWEMNGTQIATAATVGQAPTSWHIVA